MNTETKLAAMLIGGATVCVGGVVIGNYFNNKQKIEADLKKTELEASYPPEYWVAQEEKAKAEAEVKKFKIESQERLELDERQRKEAEIAQKREFEKNAPAEYWEHKKIEEQEKTARELSKQRFETERAMAKQHSDLIREGAKVAESVAKYGQSASSNFSII